LDSIADLSDFSHKGVKECVDICTIRKVRALSRPKRKEFGVSGFLGGYGQVSRERALKGVRENSHIWLVELIEEAVLNAASKSSRESTSKSGLFRLPAENGLAVICVRSRFLACEKSSSHLDAFRSEGEGSDDSARISNTTCGDDRELYGIDYLWNQRDRPRQGIFG
jgi:hypothetical protein